MISNPSAAVPEPPQAARQAALNAVLRRLVAVPPPVRAKPAAARPPAPAADPVLAGEAPASAVPGAAWLTAPVLKLAIPASPFAAGGALAPAAAAGPEPVPAVAAEPIPAPPPETPPQAPAPVEAAAAEAETAGFEVPPVIEPVAPEPEPSSIPDPAAQVALELAAILAAAPKPVLPTAVDVAAALAPPAPSPPPAPPPTAPPPAAPTPPAPPPAPHPRTAAAPRVQIRRVQPKAARPPRKGASSPDTAATKLADRLDRVGGARAQRPRAAAAHPAPPARPRAPEPPPPAARAPGRDRPAMAPAAANIARLPRNALAPAAVPETRPLTQNRRLYRRVMLTAELEVDGTPCRLIDLSIGGFAASGATSAVAGAVVPVTLRMTIDGINIGTEFSARMVYGNGARAAGRFVELTAAQTAFLRYIVTWRGEAIGAVGTTTLLDAITRWPERAFQPHPSTVRPPAQPQGFWSRLIGRIPLLGWRRRD